MAFPISPTNGQITVVNQVSYQYSTATNSWTRILSTANIITANTIAVNGVLTVGGIISAIGNITSNTGSFFIGNGSQLTGLSSAVSVSKIENGTSNVKIAAANANVSVSVDGISNVLVFSNTGAFISGVVSASGNIDGGNLNTGGLVTATGNVTGGNLLTGGLVSATATITGGNVLTGGLISATGNITSAANVSGGNVLTGGVISATANITGGNLVTGGVISATANITGGNLVTGGVISATANITGGNLVTGGVISATANITGGNLTSLGKISAGGNVDITTNYYFGNGSQLTGIITSVANINNGTSNVSIYAANANVAVSVDGTSNVAIFATTGEYITGVLSATANITGGNLVTGGVISATANITGGNLVTGGLITATGNIMSAANVSGGNILTGGLISATGNIETGANVVATANVIGGNISTGGLITATGNVQGANILTGGFISATGNVTGGNVVTGGAVSATGNVTGGNLLATIAVITGNIIGNNAVTITTTSNANINLQPNGSGNIVLANTYINSVAYPAQDTDAATKLYVDNMVSTALIFHEAVQAATANTLANTTSGAITYAQPNGAANGIGAKLTTTGTFNLIDTANVQTVGTRILIKNEANAVHNGVYTWANTTNIVRSTDTDQYGPDTSEQISINDYFFVQTGAVNGGSAYVVDAPPGTITFGTSNITFAQFSQASIYTANTSAGLSLVGAQFNAKVDNETTAFDAGGNISVKVGANLTTPNIGAATGTSLSTTGNIQGGNILTVGLMSATGTGTFGNVITGGPVSATGNITGGNIDTGGLISATGNITSAANVSGGNILTGGLISATANITGGNILTGGLISATGTITSAANITGGNLLTGGLISAGGQIAIASVTGNSVSTTGNIAGGFIFGNGALLTGVITSVANINNGTSNVSIYAANANVAVSVDGTSNVAVFANTGEYITGVLSASGTVIGGNVVTGGFASVTANITGGNVLTIGLISATGNVTSGNLVTGGLVSATGNVYGGNILSDNYLYANGTPVPPGIIYTANTSPPTSPAPKVTDQWYNTVTDVLYQYLDDGTNDYWVDISSPAFAGGVVANISISGSMLVNANTTYDIGSSSQEFRNAYVTSYNGNVGVFRNSVSVNSAGSATAIINGAGNGVGNIGSSGSYFNRVWAASTSAVYSDLAENYTADAIYEPGTVVDFGGNEEITLSTVDSSIRIAGVVSTAPAYLMNAGLDGKYVVTLALLGRVPAKVTGVVHKGDMMVSAGDGRARAIANEDPVIGTIIGKALENFNGGEGIIEIVIGKL